MTRIVGGIIRELLAMGGDGMPKSATVLVLDDEEVLRRLVCRAFENDGWLARAAPDGEVGLRVIQDAVTPIDLVVTDLGMPNVSGRVVVEVLAAYRPELPVICMTGSDESAHALATAASRPVYLLRKPFAIGDLVVAGRALVEAARTGRPPSEVIRLRAVGGAGPVHHPIDLIDAARQAGRRRPER